MANRDIVFPKIPACEKESTNEVPEARIINSQFTGFLNLLVFGSSHCSPGVCGSSGRGDGGLHQGQPSCAQLQDAGMAGEVLAKPRTRRGGRRGRSKAYVIWGRVNMCIKCFCALSTAENCGVLMHYHNVNIMLACC